MTDRSAWLIVVAQATASSLIIALPVAFSVVATYNLAPRRATLRYPALVLTVLLSSSAGVALMMFVDGYWDEVADGGYSEVVFRYWFRYGLICALFTAAYVFLRVADEDAASAREAERVRALLVKRTQEARLKVLQAQIEPHFLFNTLANVRRLYQSDAAAGESMLGNLLRYLAVALPQMRAATSTLGREAALAESFLEIQRIRMGSRLAFEIDIPAALRDVALPPMMLLTLVENAIKHGLAPLPEGGSVRISASVNNAHELVLRIADTGQGFTRTSGGGTGLSNVRARLAGLYGAAGSLSLSLNTPRGVTATIALPMAPASAGAGSS